MSDVSRTAPPGRIVIIGAGPCGLACAQELVRLEHHNWLLLEASRTAGGLASSVTDESGFTWDLGGHVVFSHFGEFDRLLADLFSPEELLHHDRSSFIRFRDDWIPYPFQQHLHRLPPEDRRSCSRDLRLAHRQHLDPGTSEPDFAAWLLATYGNALVERFFRPYNTKVWATPPEDMTSSWVTERLAPSTPGTTHRRPSGGTTRANRWGPNATFAFPATGGTGEIWRRLAVRLGTRVRTNARVTAVDVPARCVTLASGERLPFDHLVTTAPLDQLVMMASGVSADARTHAQQLKHTTVAMVGLGYRAPTTDTRSWLYFPQADVPFYRATNFSRYSPANVPASDTSTFSSWMTETSLTPGTPVDTPALIRSCDWALRGHGLVSLDTPLASAHVEIIPYAYPVPTAGRDAALTAVVPWLERHGIHPRGRFGTWRYEIGNMDHAVKMGIDMAHRLVHGAPESLAPALAVPAATGRSE